MGKISALNKAVQEGNVKLVEKLITKGKDVNAQDGQCNRPLILAVKSGHKEMAELLWSMGSDEQAEMLHHLEEISGGEYHVMMQFLDVRVWCEARKKSDPRDKSLGMFQAMFSSAFRHAKLENY